MAHVRAIISEEDELHIAELRKLVANDITPYYDTDYNLLRWLKGHNYNLQEIVPKLKNHMILRKSHLDLDTMTTKQRDSDVHYYWKSGLTTLATKTPNAFVNIEQTGTNDFWGMLHTFPLNEIMKSRIYDLEKMLKAVMDHERETGKQASILYVMDLTGLSFHANLITLLTGPLASISAFISEHYVELIHTFVLVGVPPFISAVWSIAKPLLPERTKHKVKILGSDWRKEILQIASPEALPHFWNEEGTSTVFLAKIERSISIEPSKYYKKEQSVDITNVLGISAGKSTLLDIEAKAGQTLSWRFETDGHCAYGIYFSANVEEKCLENMKPVYPRFNKVPGPTFVPLTDFIVCPETGIYKFWFSNEHAWLHTLHIRYKIDVD